MPSKSEKAHISDASNPSHPQEQPHSSIHGDVHHSAGNAWNGDGDTSPLPSPLPTQSLLNSDNSPRDLIDQINAANETAPLPSVKMTTLAPSIHSKKHTSSQHSIQPSDASHAALPPHPLQNQQSPDGLQSPADSLATLDEPHLTTFSSASTAEAKYTFFYYFKYSVVYLACIFFGLSAWIAVNALYSELPEFSNSQPEAQTLSSYLIAAQQIGNILFFIFLHFFGGFLFRRPLNMKLAILIFLLLNVFVLFLVSFAWQHTVWIAGGHRSIVLYVGMAIAGFSSATSNVFFFPIVSQFPQSFTNAYSIGLGAASALVGGGALVQDAGSIHRRFTAEVFFYFLAILICGSVCAYSFLCWHPWALELKNDHNSKNDDRNEKKKVPFLPLATLLIRGVVPDVDVSNIYSDSRVFSKSDDNLSKKSGFDYNSDKHYDVLFPNGPIVVMDRWKNMSTNGTTAPTKWTTSSADDSIVCDATGDRIFSEAGNLPNRDEQSWYMQSITVPLPIPTKLSLFQNGAGYFFCIFIVALMNFGLHQSFLPYSCFNYNNSKKVYLWGTSILFIVDPCIRLLLSFPFISRILCRKWVLYIATFVVVLAEILTIVLASQSPFPWGWEDPNMGIFPVFLSGLVGVGYALVSTCVFLMMYNEAEPSQRPVLMQGEQDDDQFRESISMATEDNNGPESAEMEADVSDVSDATICDMSLPAMQAVYLSESLRTKFVHPDDNLDDLDDKSDDCVRARYAFMLWARDKELQRQETLKAAKQVTNDQDHTENEEDVEDAVHQHDDHGEGLGHVVYHLNHWCKGLHVGRKPYVGVIRENFAQISRYYAQVNKNKFPFWKKAGKSKIPAIIPEEQSVVRASVTRPPEVDNNVEEGNIGVDYLENPVDKGNFAGKTTSVSNFDGHSQASLAQQYLQNTIRVDHVSNSNNNASTNPNNASNSNNYASNSNNYASNSNNLLPPLPPRASLALPFEGLEYDARSGIHGSTGKSAISPRASGAASVRSAQSGKPTLSGGSMHSGFLDPFEDTASMIQRVRRESMLAKQEQKQQEEEARRQLAAKKLSTRQKLQILNSTQPYQTISVHRNAALDQDADGPLSYLATPLDAKTVISVTSSLPAVDSETHAHTYRQIKSKPTHPGALRSLALHDDNGDDNHDEGQGKGLAGDAPVAAEDVVIDIDAACCDSTAVANTTMAGNDTNMDDAPPDSIRARYRDKKRALQVTITPLICVHRAPTQSTAGTASTNGKVIPAVASSVGVSSKTAAVTTTGPQTNALATATGLVGHNPSTSHRIKEKDGTPENAIGKNEEQEEEEEKVRWQLEVEAEEEEEDQENLVRRNSQVGARPKGPRRNSLGNFPIPEVRNIKSLEPKKTELGNSPTSELSLKIPSSPIQSKVKKPLREASPDNDLSASEDVVENDSSEHTKDNVVHVDATYSPVHAGYGRDADDNLEKPDDNSKNILLTKAKSPVIAGKNVVPLHNPDHTKFQITQTRRQSVRSIPFQSQEFPDSRNPGNPERVGIPEAYDTTEYIPTSAYSTKRRNSGLFTGLVLPKSPINPADPAKNLSSALSVLSGLHSDSNSEEEYAVNGRDSQKRVKDTEADVVAENDVANLGNDDSGEVDEHHDVDELDAAAMETRSCGSLDRDEEHLGAPTKTAIVTAGRVSGDAYGDGQEAHPAANTRGEAFMGALTTDIRQCLNIVTLRVKKNDYSNALRGQLYSSAGLAIQIGATIGAIASFIAVVIVEAIADPYFR